MPGISYDASSMPTVGRMLGDDSFVRLIVGPVGSGKSSGCCVEIPRRAVETPAGPDGVRRSRWAVIRNTYRDLQDTTIKTFRQWVPEGVFGTWRVSDHVFTMKFQSASDGSMVEGEVLFRALDRPDDVRKLLSLELTGCYFNETREIARSVFDVMRTRVGRYPRKQDVSRYWTGVWGDTNPMDTDHYLYKIFEEEKPDGFKLFKQPGGRSINAENKENLDACWDPEPNLSASEYSKARKQQRDWLAADRHESPCRCYYLRLMHGARPDYIRVYVDGEYGYVQDGKPVYPEFQDSVHVAKDSIELLPGCRQLFIGNDFGLTPAAVWAQQDPQDGQWQVIKELVSEHLGAVRFGAEQLRICKTEFRTVKSFDGVGDPAGMAQAQTDETTPIDIINSQGVPMRAAPTNDFTLRREAVAGLLTRLTRLGRPALIISPDCKQLRKGMAGGYNFRRVQVSGDERYEDKPNKNMFSHVCEALQYLLVGQGEDRKALDGGQPRRVSVNIRVHSSSGTHVVRQSSDPEEDYGTRRVRVPKVRR